MHVTCYAHQVKSVSCISVFEHWTEIIIKEIGTFSYVHPLIQFMLELWHPLTPGNRVQPFQLMELCITFWTSGRPGRTVLQACSPTLRYCTATQQLPNDRASSLLFPLPSGKITAWGQIPEGGKCSERHTEWVTMELAGLGAWPCLLSLSPLTGTVKTELMASLKCHKNRSGKAKPKAEEFHEKKAISFLCSAYRKISESTLSFPKRYLCC